MWDFLCPRMFGANGGDAGVGGLASFGESIIARVKIFAFLSPKQSVALTWPGG